MKSDNKVKVLIALEDSYLDLEYYKTQIDYWDGESISKSKQPCFKIGTILLSVMEQLDGLGKDLEVEFKIKNNPKALIQLQNITGQRQEKESQIRSAKNLTETHHESKKLLEFLKHHNCTIH